MKTALSLTLASAVWLFVGSTPGQAAIIRIVVDEGGSGEYIKNGVSTPLASVASGPEDVTYTLPFGLEAGTIGMTEPGANVSGFFSDTVKFTIVSGAVTSLEFLSDSPEGHGVFDKTISATNIFPETGSEDTNGLLYTPKNNSIDPGSDARSTGTLDTYIYFLESDFSIPEPGALLTFATGAAVLGFVRRRRRE